MYYLLADKRLPPRFAWAKDFANYLINSDVFGQNAATNMISWDQMVSYLWNSGLLQPQDNALRSTQMQPVRTTNQAISWKALQLLSRNTRRDQWSNPYVYDWIVAQLNKPEVYQYTSNPDYKAVAPNGNFVLWDEIARAFNTRVSARDLMNNLKVYMTSGAEAFT